MTELRVQSRWWYWVAAVPLVTAFWLASALWTVGVVVLVPEARATATSDIVSVVTTTVVSIPAVALGVPALVVFLAMPLAAHLDGLAVRDAGGELAGIAGRAAQVGVVVDAVLLAGVVVLFEGSSIGGWEPNAVGAMLVGAAVIAGTWLSVRYVRARRAVVAMPSSFREWRRELGDDETVR